MKDRMILLVEDNPDDEELTTLAIRDSGIINKLVVVRDGEEALNYFFSEGKSGVINPEDFPTVILLDLKLPKVSGLEVLEKLRSDPRTKLIPIVVLTSSSEEEDILSSYKLGANSFVRKPVDFISFAQAIKNLSLYWLLLNEQPESNL